MKILIYIILFMGAMPAFAMNFDVSPDPTPDQTAETDVYCDVDLAPTDGEGWVLFRPDGSQILYDVCNSDNGYPFMDGVLSDWLSGGDPEGLYTVASYGTQSVSWDGSMETIESAESVTTFCYGECEEEGEEGYSGGAFITAVAGYVNENLGKVLLFSAGILIFMVIKKWIFGGVSRI